MKTTALSMLTSKKFLAVLLIGLLGFVGGPAGLDPQAVHELQLALMVYIGGQAVADLGKEKAKVTP